MSFGVVMLAHERLDRVAQVIAWLERAGVPVTLHLDRRVAGAEIEQLRRFCSESTSIKSTRAVSWGRFDMVLATLDSLEDLRNRTQNLQHVVLLSGSCLPLRSAEELRQFLAAHPEQDFIESVSVMERDWVEDGLSIERFTLHHPFSHRENPWLFSRVVDLQRALRVRRALPRGLSPHLGSQWWCLSTKTIDAILDHPDRGAWDRFFRHSWIPDESYFQSLVRLVRPEENPQPSLHLNRFNSRGRPVVFHDDHEELLCGSDFFFSRKIDPDADRLYDCFLQDSASTQIGFSGKIDERPFARAREEVVSEGSGLLGPARLPGGTTLTLCDTARPYLAVLVDDEERASHFPGELRSQVSDCTVHGRLFVPDRPARFACGSVLYAGNLSGKPELRDYRASQFLARLIWQDRTRKTIFFLCRDDVHNVRYQIVRDPNARLLFVGPTDQAISWFENLRRPFDVGGAAGRKPLVPRCWYRSIEPAGRIDAELLHNLRDVALSDLNNPEGWELSG